MVSVSVVFLFRNTPPFWRHLGVRHTGHNNQPACWIRCTRADWTLCVGSYVHAFAHRNVGRYRPKIGWTSPRLYRNKETSSFLNVIRRSESYDTSTTRLGVGILFNLILAISAIYLLRARVPFSTDCHKSWNLARKYRLFSNRIFHNCSSIQVRSRFALSTELKSSFAVLRTSS